jgi:hypothetical protein
MKKGKERKGMSYYKTGTVYFYKCNETGTVGAEIQPI